MFKKKNIALWFRTKLVHLNNVFFLQIFSLHIHRSNKNMFIVKLRQPKKKSQLIPFAVQLLGWRIKQ